MVGRPPPVSLYATRRKPCLAALVFAGGIVIDLLFYFVWTPSPIAVNPGQYQEPEKTFVFLVVLLGCATFVFFGLYWTLTPRPLLQMSASRLVYRPFPLPTRTICWEDVAYVSAGVARINTSPVTTATKLTLWFTLKPDRLAAGSDQHPLHIDINLGNLSLRADDLVRLIRAYHDVQWLHPDLSMVHGQHGKTR